MKKTFIIVLACILLGIPRVSSAEDTSGEEKTKSTAVEFMQQEGTLILKEIYPESRIGGVTFRVLIIKDVIYGKKVGCLRVETTNSSKYSSDRFVGILDSDELSACIQSLRYIKTNLIEEKPTIYTECVYLSRDDVQFGAYYNEATNNWIISISPKSYNSNSMETIGVNRLDELISIMENSQELLKKALN